ncbi:uncharacterized protein C05D11.1-like [Anneissia japonica]|uniref:uncharacterized protein C05D11.1-like n=1 Tax=Anneissia japonica TaxID=1529436 RepID=UPI0014256FE1|nr:uncharacterized protein C05D11.1-like [Anneissia japonica]
MAASFEKICSVVANDLVLVSKYRSKRTGLTVCLAQVEGPLVNGYFVLATEAHDDDGLPHTLEHLIFLGSEKYPFKGVLDMLANRCLAQGTNAWTDTDHTCYTVMTAGSEGFLNLMPIYLDHVLYPTLTDAGYVTEVHHINGEGEDAGVVYCEMQARENSGESRCHLELLRAMYPGVCGYKSETGGIMANLRDSTSNLKVRNYHRDFYRADNLCLIITGQVEQEQVFEKLKEFEDKIIGKGELPPLTRPWQSPVPPLLESVVQTIPYPSDDETNGMVYIGWRGPKSQDLYEMSALNVILEYLTDTAVSPLQREFVEIKDPYCSKVRKSIIENSEACFYIKFDNTPVGKLDQIREKLLSVIGDIVSGKESIDMSRMTSVIHREILDSLNSMEERPHDTFAFICIGDFLYGNTPEELNKRLNQIGDFKKLGKEPAEYWVNLLRKYVTEAKSVTIVGKPSKELADSMASKEKERVKKQSEKLGEDGLKKMADILEKATAENETEPSEGMLSCLPVPDPASVHFHPVECKSNLNGFISMEGALFDITKLPFTFQLDDLHTNFVEMRVLLDTASLPVHLKPYLSLYLDCIDESAIMRNGVLVSHEKVVTELAADTLNFGSSIGLHGSRFYCGQFTQLAILNIKVENEKYCKGVQWLHDLMYNIFFESERVKIIATKMINDVAKMKRKGRTIAFAVVRDINFNEESNHHTSNMIRQHKFLSELVAKLDTEPDQVLKNLIELREILTLPSNIRVHMATDLKKLAAITSPTAPWESFLPSNLSSAQKHTQVQQLTNQIIRPPSEGAPTGVIVGVGSVESAFFIQTIPSISSYTDPDLPALMVYMEYLCALEGPMWRQIRGLGLAYHYRMYVQPEQGLLFFQLFKCTHVVNAYKQAKEIVDGYLSGDTVFEDVQFEAAVSSVLYEVIEREETVASTSEESLVSYLRRTNKDYNRNLLKEIAKVKKSDLQRIGDKYIKPLFDNSMSRCAVCCQTSKVDEIKDAFQGLSRSLTVMPSLEEGFPN